MPGEAINPATQSWPEVREADAPASLRAVYQEIREALRVPFVDQLWRVLANEPAYLEAAWRSLAPWLGSEQAERMADELREGAVIELAIGLPAHKAFRGDMTRNEIGADDRERISNFTMAAHYVLPKLLLAAAALRAAPLAPLDDVATPVPLPRGVAAGMPHVEPINPEEAFGEIPGLFAELRAAHGYQPIADYYRTIARAGDFLRIAWNPLRPIVGDPEYVRQCRTLLEKADALGPRLAQLSGLPPAPASLRAALGFYATRLLPETLVEVTIIKGLTDGPDGVAENRYSLARASGFGSNQPPRD